MVPTPQTTCLNLANQRARLGNLTAPPFVPYATTNAVDDALTALRLFGFAHRMSPRSRPDLDDLKLPEVTAGHWALRPSEARNSRVRIATQWCRR
jgi:hypothetical protein